MNVVVCLKQVPGTTQVKIDPQTNTLIRQGIENIINPFDTYAIEEGVRLRERTGGKVTAISMGPPQAETALREAISLGADEGILLSDPAFAGADTWATSYTISAALRKLGQYDLVICGRQTLDGDTGHVGPQLAEMLALPFIAYVSQIEEIADGSLRVQRMVEDGYEVVESPLPAVITVVKEINMPRLPSLRGIARSRSATIPVWGAKELNTDPGRVGLAGSFTQVIRIFSPQRVCQGEIFQGEAEEQVDCLVNRLKDDGFI
ncbi:MAG: electron transfer flavoprotein subunit beta [Dehalococcoidia bacterium]|nr:electron transfer flavoprotein subunit beta [Dehalococcoidia bacterium]